MTRTSWDPINELERLFNNLGRPAGTPPRRDTGAHETVTTADWVPAVDIAENDTEYLIKAELPEVPKQSVKLNVNAGVLLIQGTRQLSKEETVKYHRVERGYGRFARSFSLPEDVQEDKISAEQNEGLFVVHLPKHHEPPAKSIEIRVK